MKVIPINTVKITDLTKDPLMTGGGKAEAQFIIGPDVAKQVAFGITRFGPGGRTKLHTHTSEQVLYAIEGTGIFATETEEIIVTPGTSVYFGVEEKHWHGATKDSSFAHLTITPPHKTNY
jgi:quercetin dioxygenase-like cupin family protein